MRASNSTMAWMGACGFALVAALGTGCANGGSSSTTGQSSSTGATTDMMTTIPVTSISITDASMSTTADTSGSQGTTNDTATGTSAPTTTASTGTGTGTVTATATVGTSSSSTTSAGSSSGTTGATAWTIGWCNLQAPAMVTAAVDEAFTVYGRVYVAGLTDQSGVDDPDPQLVSEFGWGADGTQPDVDASWMWISGSANTGYNNTSPGYQANNDEYMADLSISSAGTWDYAARFSGDGGNTWSYCDLDGLAMNGYTPDQAGNATITP